jgi:hypothetical protein
MTCGTWAGYDCAAAVSDWAYSQAGQAAVITNCCATCSGTAAAASAGAATDTCAYQVGFSHIIAWHYR